MAASSSSSILSSIDACLACKPQNCPIHLPHGTDKNILFQQTVGLNTSIPSTPITSTLPDLLTRAASALCLAFAYGTCSEVDSITESHVHILQVLADDTLNIIVTKNESVVMKHPRQVFRFLRFPEHVDEFNELLQKSLTLCKEIFLDVHKVIEAVNKSDFKYLKLNSKASNLECLNSFCLRFMCIFGLVHVHMLLYLRNENNTVPGLMETLLLGALLAVEDNSTNATVHKRNAQCLELSHQLCVAAFSLTADSLSLQKTHLTRSKLIRTEITTSPETIFAKFSTGAVEKLLSRSVTTESALVAHMWRQLHGPKSFQRPSSASAGETTNSMNLSSLCQRNGIVGELTTLFTWTTAGNYSMTTEKEYSYTASSLESAVALSLGKQALQTETVYKNYLLRYKVLPKVLDSKSVSFWCAQYALNAMCGRDMSIESLLGPSREDRVAQLTAQIKSLEAERSRGAKALADKLRYTALHAHLESELLSLRAQPQSSVMGEYSQRKRDDMDRVLRMLPLTEDQSSCHVSSIWAISLRIKKEKDRVRKMRELVSMEGALHDEVAIKDATSHLKDVLLAKALEEKLASRKALDQLELDGSRVNDVLNDKKQREKEDKERARSLRLESIRLRNWKKADALGGGVVNAAPPLVVLKQTPDLPTISIAESPMMMPNKPQPTLETAPPNVNEVKVQVKRPVVKKSVEEMIWEAELARRKKDAEEAKAQQERRRKEEQKTAAFVAARARLAQGSFMWHNGKFGFYDNAKSAVTAVASDPSSWTQYQDDSGNIYYYNSITGVSQYEYPH